jgi:hypothetical protein
MSDLEKNLLYEILIAMNGNLSGVVVKVVLWGASLP